MIEFHLRIGRNYCPRVNWTCYAVFRYHAYYISEGKQYSLIFEIWTSTFCSFPSFCCLKNCMHQHFQTLELSPSHPSLGSFFGKREEISLSGNTVSSLAKTIHQRGGGAPPRPPLVLPSQSPNLFLPNLPRVPAPSTNLPFSSHWLYVSFFPFPDQGLDVKVRSDSTPGGSHTCWWGSTKDNWSSRQLQCWKSHKWTHNYFQQFQKSVAP